MRDDRDDVLHTTPAIKNIVTIVTVVTENSFLPYPIFGKSEKKSRAKAGECRGGANAPLPQRLLTRNEERVECQK